MRAFKIAIAVVLTVTCFGIPAAHANACAATSPGGGDWPSHGGDVAGTRDQASETTLGVDNVASLVNKWSFSVTTAGGSGSVGTTPVEANGCVYVQTTTGWLFALDADGGSLVWKYNGGAGGSGSSPAVNDGVVYLSVPSHADSSPSHKGLHVVALDALTGAIVYDGPELAAENEAAANAGSMASTVYFDGLLFIGVTNAEQGATRVGGYAIADASDGSLIKRVYTVPDEQQAVGFGGCSIWSTASVDAPTKQLYVGTAQPSGWFDKESELCNSIIKVDLDRSSQTFGEIVGAVKGVADDPPYIDVDFGSATTLLRDTDGRQVVAQLQKAGYVTGAYTRHMTFAWRTPVSPIGAALGNYTSSATDGHNVFTVGAYPGQLFSLNGSTGLPNWVTPVISPVATNTVAYANGVVYYDSEFGVIYGVDASNGVPRYVHAIATDNSACARNQAGGIAVARHRLFAACGPVVAAYGL